MVSVQKNSKEKGSLLIELLVALFIISIALTVVVRTFVASQHAYYTTSDKTDIVSALAFLLEDITRESRVSEGFTCTTPSSCEGVQDFTMTHIVGLNDALAGETIEYYLDANDRIQKVNIDGSNDYMTPPNIVVDSFDVTVYGLVPTDPVRARVSLSAHSDAYPENIVHLQTSFAVRPN